ncbi:hypothetical protein [Solibacillus sp. FSL H8-0538]|uniref:hypothetical protein n=1 Tax=Solibacillus sp. FSL H8-0538 TaxID=2921400 RepID=UPI0030FCC93A
MKLIIASNRQLPIRHYQEPFCQIQRGFRSPSHITLPFFVEIQASDPVRSATIYIEEVKRQYLSSEFEIFCFDQDVLLPLQQYFRIGLVVNEVLCLTFNTR